MCPEMSSLITLYATGPHHEPLNSVFTAEIREGYNAAQLGSFIIHRCELDQGRQSSAVAQLFPALLL